jgi:hypothetical protein
VETQTGRVELAYAVFDKTNGTIVHFHRHIIVSLAVRASNAADDKAAALRHAVKIKRPKGRRAGGIARRSRNPMRLPIRR